MKANIDIHEPRYVVCLTREVSSIAEGERIAKRYKKWETSVREEVHYFSGKPFALEMRWRPEYDLADQLKDHLVDELGIDDENVFVRFRYCWYGDRYVVYLNPKKRKKSTYKRLMGKKPEWHGIPIVLENMKVTPYYCGRLGRIHPNEGPGTTLYHDSK